MNPNMTALRACIFPYIYTSESTHCRASDVCSQVDEHQYCIIKSIKQDQNDPNRSCVKEDLRVLEILTLADSQRKGDHCCETPSRC